MKYKQPRSRLELALEIPYPPIISITLPAPPNILGLTKLSLKLKIAPVQEVAVVDMRKLNFELQHQ